MSNTLRFLLSITIGACLTLSLEGCGGSSSTNDDSEDEISTLQTEQSPTPTPGHIPVPHVNCAENPIICR